MLTLSSSYLDLLAMPEDQLEQFEWTDDYIDLLREKLLHEACHVLLDKCAVTTRRDRWGWIMSESLGPFSSWSALTLRGAGTSFP